MKKKLILKVKESGKPFSENAPVCGVPNGVGLPNPVASQTREEALRIAAQLGDGKDMGSWRTMSGEQYMQWWESSHKDP